MTDRDVAVGAITAAAREAVDTLADALEAAHRIETEALTQTYEGTLSTVRTQRDWANSQIDALNESLHAEQLAYADLMARYTAYRKAHPDTYALGGRTVWALQQISGKADLPALATALLDAKSTVSSIGGLSLRMGWKQYAADPTVLDDAKKIADDLGIAFCFRFMAGRFTPAKAMGNTTLMNGEPIPLPFMPDGSPNVVFEDAYRALATELADWYEANDCHLLHYSWYAGAWAELNNGLEVRNAPGYSPPTPDAPGSFLTGHLRLIDIAAQVADGRPIVTEFPVTGHGPLPVVSAAITRKMHDTFGEGTRRAVIQFNGWGTGGVFGAANPDTARAMAEATATPPVLKAVQAIQPWGQGKTYPQYTADQVKAALANADSVGSQYIEVYLPTFRAQYGGAVWGPPCAAWVSGSPVV